MPDGGVGAAGPRRIPFFAPFGRLCRPNGAKRTVFEGASPLQATPLSNYEFLTPQVVDRSLNPLQRPVDRVVVVGSREAMVRGHVKVDPARDAAGHKALEHGLILARSLAIVGHFFRDAEIHAEARADMLDAQRHTGALDNLAKAAVE